LFDFDIEVKPILEVLVGKTIEQALIEVMEEEELAELRKQQREFEELRNAEKVEQQRLEEQERRLREEKHRRMKQAADVLRLEKETAEKLAAKAFAKSYLSDLVPSVFNNLRENGYFYDPVNRDLETGFMPWILKSTSHQLEQNMLGRLLLDSILRAVIEKRENDYKQLEQKLKEGRFNSNELSSNQQQTIEINLPTSDQPQQEQQEQQENFDQVTANSNESQQETSNNQQDDVNIFLPSIS
jgi:hypothetical protein